MNSQLSTDDQSSTDIEQPEVCDEPRFEKVELVTPWNISAHRCLDYSCGTLLRVWKAWVTENNAVHILECRECGKTIETLREPEINGRQTVWARQDWHKIAAEEGEQ